VCLPTPAVTDSSDQIALLLLNAIDSAIQCSVMRPLSETLCDHFGDHQRLCRVSSTPEACGAAVAVCSGRCPVRLRGSKCGLPTNRPELSDLLRIETMGENPRLSTSLLKGHGLYEGTTFSGAVTGPHYCPFRGSGRPTWVCSKLFRRWILVARKLKNHPPLGSRNLYQEPTSPPRYLHATQALLA
jgi:hypothetical protein